MAIRVLGRALRVQQAASCSLFLLTISPSITIMALRIRKGLNDEDSEDRIHGATEFDEDPRAPGAEKVQGQVVDVGDSAAGPSSPVGDSTNSAQAAGAGAPDRLGAHMVPAGDDHLGPPPHSGNVITLKPEAFIAFFLAAVANAAACSLSSVPTSAVNVPTTPSEWAGVTIGAGSMVYFLIRPELIERLAQPGFRQCISGWLASKCVSIGAYSVAMAVNTLGHAASHCVDHSDQRLHLGKSAERVAAEAVTIAVSIAAAPTTRAAGWAWVCFVNFCAKCFQNGCAHRNRNHGAPGGDDVVTVVNQVTVAAPPIVDSAESSREVIARIDP